MIPILLLFAHWVGDYVFQTNEMANQKARGLKWLTIHVAVYAIPLTIVSFILFDPLVVAKYVPLNAGLHWIVDLATGRISLRVKNIPRLYYPIVGLDQFIHGACLIGTAQWGFSS